MEYVIHCQEDDERLKSIRLKSGAAFLKELKEFFMQNGSIGALMSGSGPTIYGLYQDEILARIAYQAAKGKFSDYEVYLCQTKVPE